MKKIILLTIFSTFLFAGCKDFLSQESKDKYVPKTADDLIELIAGGGYYDSGMERGIFTLLTDMMDDDITCSEGNTAAGYMASGGSATNLKPARSIYSWQYDIYDQMDLVTSSNSSKRSTSDSYRQYFEMYQRISICNVALDFVGKVTGSDLKKNQTIAEASALRALYYFMLVNLYGVPYTHDNGASLGVPLKIIPGYQETNITRNTVAQVYGQIVADLDRAEKAFNEMDEIYRNLQNYRVNLPMVRFLKSRVYLYMGNWAKSAEYADYFIGNSTYPLKDFTAFSQAEIDAASTGERIIGFRNMKDNGSFDPKNPEVVWNYGYERGISLIAGAYVGMLYGSMGVNDRPKQRYQFVASPALVASYEPGDLRKVFYLVRGKSTLDPTPNPEYAPFAKHPVQSSEPYTSSISFPAYAFRVAEAYLNKAEALAMLSLEGKASAADARDVINQLRKKRFAANVGNSDMPLESGQALVEYIWKERRRELNFEGHRWFDLRRQGMPEREHVWRENGVVIGTYTLQKGDPGYTLLFPPDAIRHNRALVQNPIGSLRVPVAPPEVPEP